MQFLLLSPPEYSRRLQPSRPPMPKKTRRAWRNAIARALPPEAVSADQAPARLSEHASQAVLAPKRNNFPQAFPLPVAKSPLSPSATRCRRGAGRGFRPATRQMPLQPCLGHGTKRKGSEYR
jgi:hypothetical protein